MKVVMVCRACDLELRGKPRKACPVCGSQLHQTSGDAPSLDDLIEEVKRDIAEDYASPDTAVESRGLAEHAPADESITLSTSLATFIAQGPGGSAAAESSPDPVAPEMPAEDDKYDDEADNRHLLAQAIVAGQSDSRIATDGVCAPSAEQLISRDEESFLRADLPDDARAEPAEDTARPFIPDDFIMELPDAEPAPVDSAPDGGESQYSDEAYAERDPGYVDTVVLDEMPKSERQSCGAAGLAERDEPILRTDEPAASGPVPQPRRSRPAVRIFALAGILGVLVLAAVAAVVFFYRTNPEFRSVVGDLAGISPGVEDELSRRPAAGRPGAVKKPLPKRAAARPQKTATPPSAGAAQQAAAKTGGGTVLTQDPVPGAHKRTMQPATLSPAVAQPAQVPDALPATHQHDDPALPYSLHVASHKDRAAAEQEVSRLRKLGFDAYVQEIDLRERGGVWFRVKVGRFASRAEAGTAASRFLRELPGQEAPLIMKNPR